MKKSLKIILTLAIIAMSAGLYAQTPPPPNNDNGVPTPGNNTPVGGGAPIGSGIVLLMALGAAYGGKKVFQMNKKNKVL